MSSSAEDTPSIETSGSVNIDLVMPFFSEANMTIMGMTLLLPLTLWTIKSVVSLYKNVPDFNLKVPAILIFLAPFVLSVANLLYLQFDSNAAHASVSLVSKLYIVVLFYCFYFLVREVVFFEHLLQSAEALHAEPAFTDGGSS